MKSIKFLFSPALMGLLFLLFAIAMAAATFIENDFGSSASYNMVYNTFWFEMILILLASNLIGQLVIFKLFRREKIPVLLFHLSFILMIAGAGITRYSGWEGTIHIREGEEQDLCLSNEKYLGYSVMDTSGSIINLSSDKFSLASVSSVNFKKTLKTNNKDYKLVLTRFIPNAMEEVADSPDGEPIVSLLIIKEMMNRETLILKKGEVKVSNGISVGFESEIPADMSITFDSGRFFIRSKYELAKMSMMTQNATMVESGQTVQLKKMEILSVNDIKIVPQQMSDKGEIKVSGSNTSEEQTGQNAFIFRVSDGTETATITLWDRNEKTVAKGSCIFNGTTIEVTYGPKKTKLPFSIKLNDFIIERYPGSESPSGYKSDVVLTDKSENIEKPFVIFMNNILKYRGYRFYQSSFDRDEKGTVLSVSHDLAGMLVTYSGYSFLFVFIIFAMVSKNSVFNNINAGYWQSKIRKSISVIITFLFISGLTPVSGQKLISDKAVSEELGKVLVQDQKGRTKPLLTLSSDILRKVTRENKFEGLIPMQVFIGLYLDFDNWKDFPLIRVSNNDLRNLLGIRGKYASFSDLVDINGRGTYKISKEVNNAYSKSPGERNRMDKEVMKVDERVNIVYMICKGDFLKLFPLKDKTHKWGSQKEALLNALNKEDSIYLHGIMTAFTEALNTNNISAARHVGESISAYQSKFTEYDLPSESKINAEVLYYKLSIFERLFPFYATVGLVMLAGLITMVIKGRKKTFLFVTIFGWLLFMGLLLHTFGLCLRWYIAGHSPMSNGYESMIFISWVTLVAGFIFKGRSAFAVSATAVLASMTLMVAHLSFMDPEITNLVPVLKSYWLTLHVSVITGSYGFLGLGAILGLITMILLALSNEKNMERISKTVDELTVINYKSLTLGLYSLTIGTFLGAIWANESWGRYWGWDPKETWSLITIVIYSLVVHSRSIPGLKDIYTFNLLSLFAFSSVLMTYFGVNYYLSGLHSYAGGDPVPVPVFVYISVILLSALSFFSYLKYSSWGKDKRINI